jgi:hypothetical protein
MFKGIKSKSSTSPKLRYSLSLPFPGGAGLQENEQVVAWHISVDCPAL